MPMSWISSASNSLQGTSNSGGYVDPYGGGFDSQRPQRGQFEGISNQPQWNQQQQSQQYQMPQYQIPRYQNLGNMDQGGMNLGQVNQHSQNMAINQDYQPSGGFDTLQNNFQNYMNMNMGNGNDVGQTQSVGQGFSQPNQNANNQYKVPSVTSPYLPKDAQTTKPNDSWNWTKGSVGSIDG